MIPPEIMTTLLTGGHGLLLIGVLLIWFRQRDGERAHGELKAGQGSLEKEVKSVTGAVQEIAGELKVLRPIVERRLTARPSTGD